MVAPLYESRPDQPAADESSSDTVEFVSTADGTSQLVVLHRPSATADRPLPLVLAPHPITWTATEDYSGGLPDLRRGYHRGWNGLAHRYQVLIAQPHGHHRRVELCSLAAPQQVEDLAALPDVLERSGIAVDRRRIYACGLSMGGQEALVLAGHHPALLAAVFAFNPIVDLAAWHDQLAASTHPEIRRYRTHERVAVEVGGPPEDNANAYSARSATNYVSGLANVPTMLYWSAHDPIVPDHVRHHAYHLYTLVKAGRPDAPIAEYEHTRSHGIDVVDEPTAWMLHEWCDYELALNWLLTHERPSAGEAGQANERRFST